MSRLAPTNSIGPLFTQRAQDAIEATVAASGPLWQDQAYAIAVRLLNEHQWIVARHIWQEAPPTDHPQAMGGVTQRLAREGIAYCSRIVHRYEGAERSEQVWARCGISEHSVLDMVANYERSTSAKV